MRHKWEDYVPEDSGPGERLMSHGWRRCAHCGVIQERCQNQVWGRVTGYVWYPPAGLTCKNSTKVVKDA